MFGQKEALQGIYYGKLSEYNLFPFTVSHLLPSAHLPDINLRSGSLHSVLQGPLLSTLPAERPTIPRLKQSTNAAMEPLVSSRIKLSLQ